MKFNAERLMVLVLYVAISGCQGGPSTRPGPLEGDWTDVMGGEEVVFTKDGKYSKTLTIDAGYKHSEAGVYDFDGRTLTLKPDRASEMVNGITKPAEIKAYSYAASLNSPTNLEVTDRGAVFHWHRVK